ncbi:Arm DNA-binding domain-containing protein [Klebsiella variicola subsp. variicola]|nr:Arm DNA-binding domain-containing protein [Klebsiella variicola subsp. variicola]
MPLTDTAIRNGGYSPNDSLTDMDGHSLSVSKSGSKNGNFTTIITENNAA